MLVKHGTIDAHELRRRLDQFEAAYETPSHRLADAFRENGRLVETDDFREWNMTYTAWCAVTTRASAQSA